MYDKQYAYTAGLEKDAKAKLQLLTQEHLTQMLGVEVDNVMAEYVVAMIGNKKTMEQIAADLVDFIGEESAEQFVEWLATVLPTYDGGAATTKDAPEPAQEEQPTATEDSPKSPPQSTEVKTDEDPAPTKRVISLKGIASSGEREEKKIISLSGPKKPTIRSLSGGNDSDNLKELLARRSQRFGAVERSSPAKKESANSNAGGRGSGDESRRNSGDKRKATAAPAGDGGDGKQGRRGRVAQLLGPPVNVDQAELDARDSLTTNKRRKTRPDDERRGGRNDQENHDNDSNHNKNKDRKPRRQSGEAGKGDAPPLPPTSGPDGQRFCRDRPYGRDGPRGPHGGFRGPPGGYGDFPPHPYGHPMYYTPPFGHPGPMPPYGMGYPPHGMPPHHGHPRGAYGHPGHGGPHPGHHMPRGGPRPSFQNKKWVNPNVAQDEAADSTSAPDSAAPALNAQAPAFAPRNPYFQAPRPRFQNKTWVRPEVEKDEDLSSSLPKTPPQEELEKTD
ncbi:TPA: hypothetical protein N0F65_009785 [Lagenidium giganteum]|uniref:PWI domain-containing protein n=1 Tax=Lagenidium giganteum TaxID=4803 RepID=A0AAV2YS59_9STRA|nr:TPA: hypothetical protein N0F65_009785 [Lagenidium giganteum]